MCNAGLPVACDAHVMNYPRFDAQSEVQARLDFCEAEGAGGINCLDQNYHGDACESLAPGFRYLC